MFFPAGIAPDLVAMSRHTEEQSRHHDDGAAGPLRHGDEGCCRGDVHTAAAVVVVDSRLEDPPDVDTDMPKTLKYSF